LLSTHHAQLPHVLDRFTKLFLVKKPTKTGSIDRSRERERSVHKPSGDKIINLTRLRRKKKKKKVFYIIIIIIIIISKAHDTRMMQSLRCQLLTVFLLFFFLKF
jgi:hypothetical protein